MDKKITKILKVIAIVCVIILIIEFVYILFLRRGKSVYFDGINSIMDVDDGYVVVGSNNNNDKYFEKAKLTKYNLKKEKKFEKIYNKGYNGAFFDIATDGNSYIAVGSYEASSEEHEKGIRRALIVKYDNEGNLLVEKDLQILDNSKFVSIYVVDDGYIVCGQSIYENMKIGLAENGGAILVKYDKELNEEWRSNFGSNQSAIYNELVIVDENIYVVGKDEVSTGIINKYDMSGNMVKNNLYHNTDDLGFTDVVISDNDLFVSMGKQINDTGETDAGVVQYNFDLEIINEVIHASDNNERYNKLVVDDEGSIVAIGTMATLDENSFKSGVDIFTYDSMIAKYDKNLEKISVIIYGDERDDYFTDILIEDEIYLVVGYSSYEDGSYLSKFITYSDALKVLGVE